ARAPSAPPVSSACRQYYERRELSAASPPALPAKITNACCSVPVRSLERRGNLRFPLRRGAQRPLSPVSTTWVAPAGFAPLLAPGCWDSSSFLPHMPFGDHYETRVAAGASPAALATRTHERLLLSTCSISRLTCCRSMNSR